MRVVIGEDETLTREGLAFVLRDAGFEVAGLVGDAEALLELVGRELPDVVVTDIRMPPDRTDDGMRAAILIRHELGIPVVVVSQHVHRRYALDLLRDGTTGVGYLRKDRVVAVEQFARDVERVAAGETVLDPDVVAAIVARSHRSSREIEQMTPRQREVLELVAQGLSNAAIARRLIISEKAVVEHVSNIYDTLGLLPSGEEHRRVLAVIRFLTR